VASGRSPLPVTLRFDPVLLPSTWPGGRDRVLTGPGQPFSVPEVFTVAQDRDVGGAILTTPNGKPLPVGVPGPVAGAGLLGLILADACLLGW
jgi:hypothetical protein